MPNHKARLITTREGRFVNVEDIRKMLNDDVYVNEQLVPLLKIGRDKDDSATQIVRIIAGAPLLDAIKGICGV